jgi:hypothetical protein
MRFKATKENLTIQVSPVEMAECVRRVVRLLVPHHTRKVYLYELMNSAPFPINEPGLSVVDTTDLPSNLHRSFRIIRWPDNKLEVVSGRRRFTCREWRDLAMKLEAHAT